MYKKINIQCKIIHEKYITTEHDPNEDTTTVKIPRDNRYRDRDLRERDHDRDRDRDRGNIVPLPFLIFIIILLLSLKMFKRFLVSKES